MLTRLTLANVALIESLDLALQNGLTVITGETGAGKSLLLDGLGLALGQRAEASLIRAGCTTAEASATFTAPLTPDLKSFLDDQGLEIDETPTAEITLRRQLKKDPAGALSGKAWLNGTPVAASVLAQAADLLVDVHAQHATQQLFSPAAQTSLLDGLAGATAQAAATAAAHAAWQAARAEVITLQEQSQNQSAMATLTAAWLEELNALHYREGEENDLATQRAELANAAALTQHLELADQALTAEGAALTALHTARRAAEQAARLSPALQPLADRLQTLLTEAQDVSYDLSRAMPGAGGHYSLEAIDDRLHALRAAARKHRIDVSGLASLHTSLQEQSQKWANLDDALHAAQKHEKETQKALTQAAQALTTARQKALPTLATQLQKALTELHLPHARVEIALTPQPQPTAQGAEKVTILFSANPGQPPAPLAKTASGGELSRAMLALKSILFGGLSPRTVVLDEVDTGTSGPTASAIGSALHRLALQHQCITITHHPQVAAHAQHHLFLAKSVENNHTKTTLITLNHAQRITELARLLSGNEVTPQARAAAESLLQESQKAA